MSPTSHPWSVHWRKALVSAPRLVPDFVLRFTSPEGPQPIVINLPSRSTHQIPLYIFVPPTSKISLPSNAAVPALTPVLLDFHGGGFVLGSCQEQTPFCARVCRELNCVVISVDYRLGPYAKHPAALEDAEDVLRSVLRADEPGYAVLRDAVNGYLARQSRPEIKLDVERVGLSGFSSGGNLALNLVLNVNAGRPGTESLCPFPEGYGSEIPVLMFYAAIDLRKLPSERDVVEGFNEVPKSFFASLGLEQHLMRTYLPIEQVMEPRASPGLVDVGGVGAGVHEKARFLVVLAEKDRLTPQNEVWAEKMAEAGREEHVVVHKVSGVAHGWTQFPDSWLDDGALQAKRAAYERSVDFLRKTWATAT